MIEFNVPHLILSLEFELFTNSQFINQLNGFFDARNQMCNFVWIEMHSAAM